MTSEYATLHFAKETAADGPLITLQPVDCTVEPDGTAEFSVLAQGEGLSYLWQYQAKNETEKWTDWTAKKTADITCVPDGRNGMKVRCRITDRFGNTVLSDVAVITINTQVVTADVTQNYGYKYRCVITDTVSTSHINGHINSTDHRQTTTLTVFCVDSWHRWAVEFETIKRYGLQNSDRMKLQPKPSKEASKRPRPNTASIKKYFGGKIGIYSYNSINRLSVFYGFHNLDISNLHIFNF